MFSVLPELNKYRIKLSGDRRKYLAGNLKQVHNALDHYHALPHDKENCPLCKHKEK